MSELELGQALFSNGSVEEYDAEWATMGLEEIADVIAVKRGLTDDLDRLTSNSGGERFENETFSMSSYCWCSGGAMGHEANCPPNFIYKPTGLAVTWYKHARRGIRANVEEVKAREWLNIVDACIASIK